MRVTGLDLSLTSTGIVLIAGGRIEVAKNIPTNSTEKWQDRVKKIRDQIIEVAVTCDKVYMENYAFGSKFNREVLGEIGGIVKLSLADKGIFPILLAPSSIKRFATGRGSAPPVPKGEPKSNWGKKWMRQQIKQNFGHDFDIDDIADAFVIAQIGYMVEEVKENPELIDSLPTYQVEVIQNIIKGETNSGEDITKSSSIKQSRKRRRGNS